MIYKRIKRIADIMLSIIGLIILSPLFLITAFAIKIDSSGPVVFKQERLGLYGKVFKMYKFRSMYVGAEQSGVYEFKEDKRVTRVGKFIRRTSIDELPQIVNIVRGDMSFVGPRPTLIYHPWPIEGYSEVQKQRFNVRPGITGWAQINGRKGVPWDKRLALDVWYIHNISFALDVQILIRTMVKVLAMTDNVNVAETAAGKAEVVAAEDE